MDILAIDEAAADAASRFTRLGESEAWSVVSTRPVKLGDAATTASSQSATTRLSEVAPYDLVAVQLIYANWQNAFGSAEAANYNAIRVQSAFHKAGAAAPSRQLADPYFPVTFRGSDFGICQPGQLLLSDPVPIWVAKGERYFHETFADPFIPAGPVAPTLSVGSGGSMPIATNYVCITYVFANGTESLPSPEVSASTTSGNQTLTVTSPPAVAGAVGWRAYFGASAGAVKYENPYAPMAPIGTNIVLANSVAGSALSRLLRGPSQIGVPVGRGYLKGCGENSIVGRDYTTVVPFDWGSSTSGSFSGVFGPVAVRGIAADGRVHPSPVIKGDSIQAGTGDTGYGGALGGFGFRAFANQTERAAFDPTKNPKHGFLTIAQGGETGKAFATSVGGSRRRQLAEFGTSMLDNYGTNDTAAGDSGAVIVAMIIDSNRDWVARGKKYFRATIDPKTTSTDGFRSVSNQTIASTDAEAARRQVNNVIRSTLGAVVRADEPLLRSQGTAVASDSLYSGGNGSTTKFFTQHPFRVGSETVKVADVIRTVTTHYTYIGTATIDGVTYASGITFLSAPANGAAVTMTYTKVPGLTAREGYSGFFDTATEVEVNGAGAKAANGGFWAPATGAGTTGTSSAATANVITDASQSWTVDQWAGFAIEISGQIVPIQSNTATALTLGASLSPVPAAVTAYEIYQPHVIDGVHGTSEAQRKKALIIDTDLF